MGCGRLYLRREVVPAWRVWLFRGRVLGGFEQLLLELFDKFVELVIYVFLFLNFCLELFVLEFEFISYLVDFLGFSSVKIELFYYYFFLQ